MPNRSGVLKCKSYFRLLPKPEKRASAAFLARESEKLILKMSQGGAQEVRNFFANDPGVKKIANYKQDFEAYERWRKLGYPKTLPQQVK